MGGLYLENTSIIDKNTEYPYWEKFKSKNVCKSLAQVKVIKMDQLINQYISKIKSCNLKIVGNMLI